MCFSGRVKNQSGKKTLGRAVSGVQISVLTPSVATCSMCKLKQRKPLTFVSPSVPQRQEQHSLHRALEDLIRRHRYSTCLSDTTKNSNHSWFDWWYNKSPALPQKKRVVCSNLLSGSPVTVIKTAGSNVFLSCPPEIKVFPKNYSTILASCGLLSISFE